MKKKSFKKRISNKIYFHLFKELSPGKAIQKYFAKRGSQFESEKQRGKVVISGNGVVNSCVKDSEITTISSEVWWG